jgi:phosphatidate cytidylyltransferase
VQAPVNVKEGTGTGLPAPKSNLALRLATAAVGAPAILALLYLGPPWAFYFLVLPATLIGCSELFAMTHPDDGVARAAGLAVSFGVSVTLFAFGLHEPRALLTMLLVVPAFGPLFTLVRLGDIQTAALRSFALGFGPLFVAVPLTLLARMPLDFKGDGPGLVVMSIMFAWWGDTGGYFAGRFLGKRKLYEAVSPKKTVEGALGGLAGSVLGAIVASFWYLPRIPITHSVPLALVAGVLGQAGDLGESLIKRSTGVKDSGAIVPGHGGILDRVDALLMTTGVVYLYAAWVWT